jgi:hypothetical protein
VNITENSEQILNIGVNSAQILTILQIAENSEQILNITENSEQILDIAVEDWINMELVTNPDKDLLSYFERFVPIMVLCFKMKP